MTDRINVSLNSMQVILGILAIGFTFYLYKKRGHDL